jgi:carbonic anhydrase/acetyltransferase-like protein (isoleucine patch superfamily)
MRFFNKIINVIKKILFLFKNIRSIIKFDIKIYNNGKIKLGKNILIERGCVIHVKKNCSLEIEDNVFIGKDSEINSTSSILISENTSVQSRSNIFGEVKILSNCILGANVYLSSIKHIFSYQPHELIIKQDELTVEKYSNPIYRLICSYQCSNKANGTTSKVAAEGLKDLSCCILICILSNLRLFEIRLNRTLLLFFLYHSFSLSCLPKKKKTIFILLF